MLEPKYKRILLKLSGEAISGSDGIIDFDFLDRIAATLVEISAAGVETAVIFGAGNIWRGRQGGEMNRVTADRMGMLATVINSLAAKDAVERAGGKAEVYTSTDMMPYAEYYTADRAIKSLSEGKVVIFGGGTGCPYFSTDTAGMLRAIEIGADAFLLAKNVDGIYDRDPKEGNAKLFDEIGYMDMVKLGLRGIDLTASAMGAEFGPPAVAFRLADVEDIKRAVEGKGRGTVIVRN
ncbi:MAG: uridine monophosphate kinase [Clostridiales bacterium]|nr:uridine monophosphate kinase [Clostridiales bacterium]